MQIAVIDEKACIGCSKCIPACPVDCIIGAPKYMHTVLNNECINCKLCIAPCPVDCISIQEVEVTMDKQTRTIKNKMRSKHKKSRNKSTTITISKSNIQDNIKSALIRNQANNIFKTLQKNNPSPTTELIYQSTFELLISVILSAQATDISVNKATKGLFCVANTPNKILKLGEKKLKEYIKTIGLYNTKAQNIIKTCKLLVDEFNSEIPATREQLETLPGVGRKTANVVLNTAFGIPTIAVDTHIFRVANRLGLANGKTPLDVEQQLLNVIGKKYLQDAHHWLILHGRYICIARNPKCGECPISGSCEHFGARVV